MQTLPWLLCSRLLQTFLLLQSPKLPLWQHSGWQPFSVRRLYFWLPPVRSRFLLPVLLPGRLRFRRSGLLPLFLLPDLLPQPFPSWLPGLLSE